jgi:hypothetical protein
MSLVVGYDPAQNNFERPTGLQQAVVTSVIDLGFKPDPFNEGAQKHQIAMTWQLASTYKDKTGKVLPMQQTEMYNLSLHEKAKLRSIVEGMLGKSLGKGILSLDLETLIGTQCMLTLQKKDAESIFTSTVAAAPLLPGMKPITVVPLPIPQWIIKMRDGTAAPVDPSSKLSDAEIDAMVAKV